MQVITNEAIKELQYRIAGGDQAAFKKLYDYYAENLTRFSFSIVRNRNNAIEIMDTVFLKLWQNRTALPQIENLKTYLYTAIKNASLNYLSSKARQQITQGFDFIDIQLEQGAGPDQTLISAEMLKLVHAAVEKLPPRCKMIFKLVREDGLKYREVAEILNISTNTVDAQMVIAVKRISEKVRPYFDCFPVVHSKK